MAISNGKSRITITVADSVLEKLDDYCDKTGLSRSAVITDIVGSNLGAFESFNKAFAKELVGALSSAVAFGGFDGSGTEL